MMNPDLPGRDALNATGIVNLRPRLIFMILAGLSVLLGFPEALSARITKGPVLLRVNRDRVALMWETDTEGSGKVFCTGPHDFRTEVISAPDRIDYSVKEGEGETRELTAFVHKVWIEGLTAGTLYLYRILDRDEEAAEHHFRTAPAGPGQEVRFVVYGDSRTHPDRHRRVVEKIMEKKPDFVINVGDLVTSGDFYEQWGPQLFEPLEGLAESIPYYSVKGNHDMGLKRYFERLLVPSGEKNFFSFDYGPVHYCCLDNYGDSQSSLLKKLAEDFSARGGPWNFATYHVPSLNIGGHASDWGYPHALATLSTARVDFVVTGHSHVYERFRPVAPPRGMEGTHVTHITSGGGGAPSYGNAPSPFLEVSDNCLHFCLFTITGNQLSMEVIDDTGRVIDYVTLLKKNGELMEAYTKDAVSMEWVSLYQHLFRSLAWVRQARPGKNGPVQVKYRLHPTPSGEGFKAVLTLASHEKNYRLPEPRAVEIRPGDEGIEITFLAEPLTEELLTRRRHPAEALYIECRYEAPIGKGEFTAQVRLQPENR